MPELLQNVLNGIRSDLHRVGPCQSPARGNARSKLKKLAGFPLLTVMISLLVDTRHTYEFRAGNFQEQLVHKIIHAFEADRRCRAPHF
jgi:hypothetical protein